MNISEALGWMKTLKTRHDFEPVTPDQFWEAE